jgi:hypothetical protein
MYHEHQDGLQTACYKGVKLNGFNRSTYYTSKKEYKTEQEKQNGKQTHCFKGIKLNGFNRTECYETKEEYQTKHGSQKTLDQSSGNIDHIEDMDHPQTPPNSEQYGEEYKDPQYPQYPQYEKDKQLIEFARKYLQNNGGKAETHTLVLWLRENGYTFGTYLALGPFLGECFS